MERKTKIHKFTVYVYGINDNMECEISEAENIISSTRYDYIIYPYHEKTVIIDDLTANHPLNNSTLPKEAWEKYMDDNLKQLFANKFKADKELEDYKKKIGIN